MMVNPVLTEAEIHSAPTRVAGGSWGDCDALNSDKLRRLRRGALDFKAERSGLSNTLDHFVQQLCLPVVSGQRGIEAAYMPSSSCPITKCNCRSIVVSQIRFCDF